MTQEDDSLTADRPSAVDQAVGQIRDLIRDRALAVGDVLPSEAELSAMFGTGRNTIREAVRTLKAYGVVESRRNVGPVLTDRSEAALADLMACAIDISADMFRDIQGFRRLTEMGLADRVVGQMPLAALDAMAAANAAMAAARSPAEASLHDYRFHQIMVEAGGNRTLAAIHALLKPVILRLMETGKTQRAAIEGAAAEHADILAALRDGQRIDFLYHMNRHLDAGLEYIPAGRPRSGT